MNQLYIKIRRIYSKSKYGSQLNEAKSNHIHFLMRLLQSQFCPIIKKNILESALNIYFELYEKVITIIDGLTLNTF